MLGRPVHKVYEAVFLFQSLHDPFRCEYVPSEGAIPSQRKNISRAYTSAGSFAAMSTVRNANANNTNLTPGSPGDAPREKDYGNGKLA